MIIQNMIIDVIIPAFNEEKSIPLVINEIPKDLVRNIIVCDNSSTDRTAEMAKSKGAIVVSGSQKGYGSACLSGLRHIIEGVDQKPDILVFLDGDYSDYPQEMVPMIQKMHQGDYDMIIGSRALGNLEKGSMTPVQIFGNWLSTNLIKFFFKVEFTDLGPFRAIKWQKLLEIEMQDRDFGWTVEMQIKAAKNGFKCTEIPVNYRKRVGVSKVSGTVKGSILAGHKILWTIFKYL